MRWAVFTFGLGGVGRTSSSLVLASRDPNQPFHEDPLERLGRI